MPSGYNPSSFDGLGVANGCRRHCDDRRGSHRALNKRYQALVARSVRIVSAAWRVICSCGSSTDGSSTDAYGHSAAYGCTTINATTIDTTVVNAGAADTNTSSICEGIS